MSGNDWSRRGDAQLLAALAQGQSLTEAAKAARLSESTARRRLADPAFRAALSEARQRAVARAVTILASGMAEAAARLRWLSARAGEERVQLAAARTVIEQGLKGVELLDLAERITALEERLADAPTKGLGRWGA
jgi:hypothetical protein